LLERLDQLKAKGERKKWKSLYKALKSVGSKAEIEDLLERLGRYRDELELHLLINIKFAILLSHVFLMLTKIKRSQIDVKAFNKHRFLIRWIGPLS
jgi:hypothetical protein